MSQEKFVHQSKLFKQYQPHYIKEKLVEDFDLSLATAIVTAHAIFFYHASPYLPSVFVLFIVGLFLLLMWGFTENKLKIMDKFTINPKDFKSEVGNFYIFAMPFFYKNFPEKIKKATSHNNANLNVGKHLVLYYHYKPLFELKNLRIWLVSGIYGLLITLISFSGSMTILSGLLTFMSAILATVGIYHVYCMLSELISRFFIAKALKNNPVAVSYQISMDLDVLDFLARSENHLLPLVNNEPFNTIHTVMELALDMMDTLNVQGLARDKAFSDTINMVSHTLNVLVPNTVLALKKTNTQYEQATQQLSKGNKVYINSLNRDFGQDIKPLIQQHYEQLEQLFIERLAILREMNVALQNKIKSDFNRDKLVALNELKSKITDSLVIDPDNNLPTLLTHPKLTVIDKRINGEIIPELTDMLAIAPIEQQPQIKQQIGEFSEFYETIKDEVLPTDKHLTISEKLAFNKSYLKELKAFY